MFLFDRLCYHVPLNLLSWLPRDEVIAVDATAAMSRMHGGRPAIMAARLFIWRRTLITAYNGIYVRCCPILWTSVHWTLTPTSASF